MSFTEKELWERFNEGMLRAASVCRELRIATSYEPWWSIAESIETMRLRGEVMYNAKAITRAETLAGVDKIIGHMASEREKGN